MSRVRVMHVLPLLAFLACASNGIEPEDLIGTWGTDGFSLIVRESDTEIRVNCGGAILPTSLRFDSEGRFSHAFEMTYAGGAPPREGQSNVTRRPARINGRVSGAFLPLDLIVDDNSQRFVLRKGVEGTTYICP